MRWTLLSPFYREENRHLEQFDNLPKSHNQQQQNPGLSAQSTRSCHRPLSWTERSQAVFFKLQKRISPAIHSWGTCDGRMVAPPSAPCSALGLPDISARNPALSFPWLSTASPMGPFYPVTQSRPPVPCPHSKVHSACLLFLLTETVVT